MLNNAISLLGLSMRRLFAAVDQTRSLHNIYMQCLAKGLSDLESVGRAVVDTRIMHNIDWDNGNLLDLIVHNTIGGPNIVFHRYQENSVTRIRSVEYGDEA